MRRVRERSRGPLRFVMTLVTGVLGIVSITACSGEPQELATQSAPTAASSSTPTSEGGASDSVCGLDGAVDAPATLRKSFEVFERYVGATPIWSAAGYGPGAQDPSGFFYCYQRSPEGAVLAAVAMSIQGSFLDDEAYEEYLAYSLGPGPDHDELASEASKGRPEEARANLRARPLGVRVLQYDGTTALIDVAIESAYQGEITNVAGTVPLIWHEGDWKLVADKSKGTSGVVASLENYILFRPKPEVS